MLRRTLDYTRRGLCLMLLPRRLPHAQRRTYNECINRLRKTMVATTFRVVWIVVVLLGLVGFGGIDTKSVPDGMFMYPRNPRGTGIIVANLAEAVNELRLPNLEDPADLLTPDRLILGNPEKWPEQPLPQGFGWFPKIAYPRCSLVGALPAYVGPGVPLKEEMLGLVPKNQIARQGELGGLKLTSSDGGMLGIVFRDRGQRQHAHKQTIRHGEPPLVAW